MKSAHKPFIAVVVLSLIILYGLMAIIGSWSSTVAYLRGRFHFVNRAEKVYFARFNFGTLNALADLPSPIKYAPVCRFKQSSFRNVFHQHHLFGGVVSF